VVASVNGKPITLFELSKRLSPPRRLTLQDAATDVEARQALDAMIFEKLIREEASAQKISASDSEIDEYVDTVAKRNGLSREAFETALKERHTSLQEYKEQVEFEILKSKIASSFFKGGVAVSEADIDQYLVQHPELSRSGAKLKLRQIFLRSDTHSQDQAMSQFEEIRRQIEDKKPFEELAVEYSEGPEAKDGGLLGVVAEQDLSREVFDAVLPLKDGDLSAVVPSDAGWRIFRLEQRFAGENEGKKADLREEVRKLLQQQKTEAKVTAYLTSELYQKHAVDKKI
jgi:peptidyl-prolyl cis-trans isomerase SurA